MQSSHLLGCPRPLSPTTTNSHTMLSASSSSLRIMCPNQRSLASLIFPTIFASPHFFLYLHSSSSLYAKLLESISAFSSLSCTSIPPPSFLQSSTLFHTITLVLSHTYTFCASVSLVFSRPRSLLLFLSICSRLSVLSISLLHLFLLQSSILTLDTWSCTPVCSRTPSSPYPAGLPSLYFFCNSSSDSANNAIL